MNTQSGMPTSHRSATETTVVYPAQGIGTILEVEEFTYDGVTEPVYVIVFEEGGTTRVPVDRAKRNGLRPLADEHTVKAALAALAQRPRRLGGASQSRLQQLQRQLYSGDLVNMAGVVRDIYVPPPAAGDEDGVPLSPTRRRLYERAIRRVTGEIALVRGLSLEATRALMERRSRKELFWLIPDLSATTPKLMPLEELFRRTAVSEIARGSGRFIRVDGITPAQHQQRPVEPPVVDRPSAGVTGLSIKRPRVQKVVHRRTRRPVTDSGNDPPDEVPTGTKSPVGNGARHTGDEATQPAATAETPPPAPEEVAPEPFAIGDPHPTAPRFRKRRNGFWY